LNNNRGNNRRRGRGNNNNSSNNRPQNGSSQVNRIDSRARGNAPQLLEKYRKLAQDAHLNGDRVQAEYYLQFADHYFRVLADARLRQDEQRLRQNGGAQGTGFQPGGSVSGDRWQDQDGEEDMAEFGVDPDFPTFERVPQPRREEREPRREERDQREPREYRDQRERREPRDGREPRGVAPAAEAGAADVPAEGLRAAEGEPIAAASDNPFIRDARNARPPRGRNDRFVGRRGEGRSDGRGEGDTPRAPRTDSAPVAEPAPRFDPSMLPPAIGIRSDSASEAPARPVRVDQDRAAPDAAPARTGRLRMPRAASETDAAPQPAPAMPAPAMATPVTAAPVAAEADAPAPRKRGRPRKNPLPEALDAAEG
jgi:hypothetical protein